MANTCKNDCTRAVTTYPGKGLCNTCYKREQYHASKTPERMAMRAANTKRANEKRKQADPEAYALYVKDQNLKRCWGISLVDYNAMLEAQGNACLLCLRSPDEVGTLAVDHDHACCPEQKSCGKCIRGLLCGSCNNGLGRFEDDVERLRRAIAYLGGDSD